MTGFVDVSNMSDLEIKRIGQADDDFGYQTPYRNPYAYRKPMRKTSTPVMNYNAEDVWAASWQAYVTNDNSYIKAIAPGAGGPETNRQIVERLLADPTQITQECRDQGLIMQRYFHGLTFKLIEGKQLNPFLQGAYEAACKNTITTKLELGIIASLPATYSKMSERDATERRVQWARGGYIGAIGDKVTTEIEVVKRVYSQKWMTWFITGINDNDQALFFSYKHEIEIGSRVKITGTVKGTRDDVSQLNRVKVIV